MTPSTRDLILVMLSILLPGLLGDLVTIGVFLMFVVRGIDEAFLRGPRHKERT